MVWNNQKTPIFYDFLFFFYRRRRFSKPRSSLVMLFLKRLPMIQS